MSLINKNIWLFGGGGACSWILFGLKREGINIVGIMDDKPNEINDIYGIPLFVPQSEKISSKTKKDDIVIISILNPLVNTKNIIKKLKNQGWKNVFEFGDWVEAYYNESGKCTAPLSDKAWKLKAKEFLEVRSLFSDEHSVKVFDSFINFVKYGKNNFPKISKNSYFPKDINQWKTPLNFIDCGAFDGDTILDIQKQNYKINSIHAFEPDIKNYNDLIKNTKHIKGIHVWPCGVGDTNNSIRFQTQNNMGSFVDPEGNSIIQCVKLDDCLPYYVPNLIKMDIEGFEYNALCGAECMLKTHLPGLAISIYHLEDDIWKIPLFLNKIYGNRAKFYLRNHSRTIADTIFYVVPD